jgi:hypothetical protein
MVTMVALIVTGSCHRIIFFTVVYTYMALSVADYSDAAEALAGGPATGVGTNTPEAAALAVNVAAAAAAAASDSGNDSGNVVPRRSPHAAERRAAAAAAAALIPAPVDASSRAARDAQLVALYIAR